MFTKTALAIVLVAAFCACTPAHAQGGGGQRVQSAPPGARQQDRLRERDPAADPVRDQDRDKDADRELVYGHQLMTAEELAAHRTQMRSFKTEQEREAFRLQHHEAMQKRAVERGVTLPDVPARRGSAGGAGKQQQAGQRKRLQESAPPSGDSTQEESDDRRKGDRNGRL